MGIPPMLAEARAYSLLSVKSIDEERRAFSSRRANADS